MATSRQAILIANPGENGQPNYCRGVYVDIANYRKLLMSAEGGDWGNGDISICNRPSVKEVRELVRTFSYVDYMFVMFTGHGWYSEAVQDRILELRAGEQMRASDLLVGVKKRTLILDCCQKVHPEGIHEAFNLSKYAAFSHKMQPDRARCRKLFFDQVEAAPAGATVLRGCAITEVCTDDEERGGRYNASLIEAVEDWASQQTNVTDPLHRAVLSVVEAHDIAAACTRKLSENKQNPTISKPKSLPYYPFAVFA